MREGPPLPPPSITSSAQLTPALPHPLLPVSFWTPASLSFLVSVQTSASPNLCRILPHLTFGDQGPAKAWKKHPSLVSEPQMDMES